MGLAKPDLGALVSQKPFCASSLPGHAAGSRLGAASGRSELGVSETLGQIGAADGSRHLRDGRDFLSAFGADAALEGFGRKRQIYLRPLWILCRGGFGVCVVRRAPSDVDVLV